MWLGIDYYPEHWPTDMQDEDLDRIVALGANAIRIGEFAWHLIESKPGEFCFDFFDAFIVKAKGKGLSIVYGTPTATLPAWLAHEHPEVLSMDDKGHVNAFGGRREYCYNSEMYLHYSLRMVEALVKHYSTEESLFMWQIDNEFGHEGSDSCYCPICHKGFQAFLEEKHGTIDQLNNTYGTIFWGRTYNDFTEIPMPTPTITTHNPALKLDWARFRSASINTFAKAQIDCVNANKGAHQRITHNLFGGYFDRRYDQNVLAKSLDVVAFDNYPVWGGLMKPLSPAEVAMGHDYIRGLKKQNFWVMEQLIGAQGHDDIGYLPRDGESTLWAYQAMARGCESLFYFRYRGLDKGAEQFCQGILDTNNQINDKYREVQRFFNEVKEQEAELTTPMESRVAVLYQYDNRWSWYGQRQSKDFDYTKEILRCYRPFYRLNTPIDVIDVHKSWQGYDVIVLPVMQIIGESLAGRIKNFAEAGGVVIFSFRSGIKNEDNNLIFGETAPCYLNDLVGATVHAYEALGEGRQVNILKDGQNIGKAGVLRDLLKISTAKTIFTYGEPYQEFSACTVNTFGKGLVYYIGTGLEDALMDQVIQEVAEHAKLEIVRSPEGVEVVKRGEGEHGVTYVLNHLHERVAFMQETLEPLQVKRIKTVK